jgi:hypothetical protein
LARRVSRRLRTIDRSRNALWSSGVTSEPATADIIRLLNDIADRAEEQLVEVQALQARGMTIVGEGSIQGLVRDLKNQIAANRNLAVSPADVPGEVNTV